MADCTALLVMIELHGGFFFIHFLLYDVLSVSFYQSLTTSTVRYIVRYTVSEMLLWVGNRPKFESAMVIHMDSVHSERTVNLQRLHHIAHFTGTSFRIQVR